MSAPSWKAKRHGAIYCAPACGSGCTWAAYQKAIRDGSALARELPPGFLPHVWENMGWHYAATRKTPGAEIQVHPCNHQGRVISYTVFLNGTKQFVTNGRTPAIALNKAILAARAYLKQLTQQVEGL